MTKKMKTSYHLNLIRKNIASFSGAMLCYASPKYIRTNLLSPMGVRSCQIADHVITWSLIT